MVDTLKIWWDRLSSWPGGKWLFSRVAGFLIPYTGTISPQVFEVRPGFAQVSLKDCRRHRNHLRCIHAVALVNLGEFTTGLAIHFAMGSHQRAILTQLSAEYFIKARGRITATAETLSDATKADGPILVIATLVDDKQNVLAKVTATWLLGSSRAKSAKS